MATIRPHRGKYQAIIRRTGYPTKSKSFRRRADAVAWATITESEMERGEFVDRTEADRTTLEVAFTRYAEEVTPRKKGARQELVRIRYWKRHRLAKVAISRLTSNDFATWRNAELKAGKAPSTVNNGLILISHLFNQARKEWGIPVKNPISDIWRPKPRPGRTRRYRPGEEQKLIEAAGRLDPVLPLLIEFATETAMRRGELAGMVRSQRRGSTYSLPDTKNSAPRDVPLSRRAREILDALPARVDGKVWPWNANAITRLFEQARDDAGITDFTFHDLRHEATSRLARIYPIHELARITGHKTVQMLMRYYHPTADELAARLDHA